MAGRVQQRRGCEIQHAVTLRSLVIAYALGVLLTFVVVALSAWRVSVLNIVAAVRGLPEPVARRGGRRRSGSARRARRSASRWRWPGVAAAQATPFSLGVSIARHQPRAAARARRRRRARRLHVRRRGCCSLVAAAVRDDRTRSPGASSAWTSRPGSSAA